MYEETRNGLGAEKDGLPRLCTARNRSLCLHGLSNFRALLPREAATAAGSGECLQQSHAGPSLLIRGVRCWFGRGRSEWALLLGGVDGKRMQMDYRSWSRDFGVDSGDGR